MVSEPGNLGTAKAGVGYADPEWQRMVDAVGDAVCLLDLRGTVLRYNRAFAKLVGRTADEVVGGDCHALLQGAVNPPPEWPLPGMLSAKTRQEAECLLGDRWVRMVADPVLAESGALTGVVLVVSDVTGQKRADKALQESEDHLRNWSEASFEAIAIHDQGTILDVNPALCRLFGYERPELIGRSVLELAAPESRDLVLQSFRAGREEPYEAVGLRSDGTSLAGELIGRAIQYQGRQVRVTAIRDFSERKRAEEALRTSETKLRALFAAIPDVILVLDAEGRYLEIAPTNPALLYRPSEELLGQRLGEVLSEAQAQFFLDSIRRVLETGRTDSIEYSLAIGGREVFFSAVVAPMLGDRVILVARDITERRRAEDLQKAIYEISEATHQAESLKRLFVSIHKVVGRLMEARNLFIALYDSALDVITFPYFVDEEDQPPGPRRPGRGLTEYILRTGRPLLATPEVFDELIRCGEVASMGAPSIDWLGVPLVVGDRTIGVLAVQSYAQGVRYGEREKEVLEFVSRQVALAIERKRAEEALRESEEKFRTTVQSFSEGLVVVDEDARIIEWNAALEGIHGIKRQEAVGRTLWDVQWQVYLPERKTPERYDFLKDSIVQAVRYGLLPSVPAEINIRSLDGRIRTVQQTVFSMRTQRGYRIGTTITDITDRKLAEQALRESEERYRAFFEQSPIGIYHTTPEGRIVAANPAILRMLGYDSFAELATRNLEQDGFEPGYERAGFRAAVERDGEVRALDSVWTARNGQAVFVREYARAVRGSDGAVLYYEGTVEDITRWMAAEEEHRRLTAAIEQAAETIVITDTRGRIEYVNPAFERITGYARDEVLGLTPSILKSGRHDRTFYEGLWGAIGRGETWQGHFINRRKDGALFEEEATISPIRNAAGVVVNLIAVKRDVTQEVALEEQLRQAQKMEAVGRLAGGIAHDFNNLLQAMLSHAELLRGQSSDPEKAHSVVVELEQQITRGASLTRQLLLFSRRETAKPERVDLNATVRDAVQILERLKRANIALVIELAPQALLVEADRGQLQQVLLNLTLNASDAMPDGGKLQIRTGTADGSEVYVSVEDNGVGIPETIRERIFEPFFTTKEPGKGTGLGLSVVHGIVTSHRGRIEVESLTGRGSTFRVVLPQPVSAEASPAKEIPPVAPELELGMGERILVVEDEDGAREGLRDILASLGYEVVAVGSGEEAENLPDHEPFDLLLTDVMLPGVAGPQLARELLERWPRLRVIVMSGYSEDEAVRRGVTAGDLHFLQKPFNMATLAHETRAALDERTGPAGA